MTEDRNAEKRLRYIIGYNAPLSSIPSILKVDLAKAEELLAAFRVKYPELTEHWKSLNKIALSYQDNTKKLALDLEALVPKFVEVKEDKTIRQSAKTGATWPKAKGSY